MALTLRVPDAEAMIPDPVNGINLRESEINLQPGDARLMQNMIWRGGTRTRLGSSRITPTALSTNQSISGGHKYYYGGPNPASQRLVSYGTTISSISSSGVETKLTTSASNAKNVYFSTWTITDNVYMSNGTDALAKYNGNNNTYSKVTGTNIPGSTGFPAARMMTPMLDRLLAITSNGVEVSNPRVDNQWSFNSSWSTYRPSPTGPVQAIYPHSLQSVLGDVQTGVIVLQGNSYSWLTGTNFGADVTAASPPTDVNISLLLIDPRVGTSSPYSVTSVPGMGLFWLTSDLYVYWLPYGQAKGQYVGDKINSTGKTAGTESTNPSAIDQCYMVYFERFLRLGVPLGNSTFPNAEFWLDMRRFMQDPTNPVWYGPMVGPTHGRKWAEVYNGDNLLVAGEGNARMGAFVYQADVPNTYTDAVGAADANIVSVYQTMFHDFHTPSQRKYLRNVELDMQVAAGAVTADVYDVYGALVLGQPLSTLPPR